jgi:hypothetical protein
MEDGFYKVMYRNKPGVGYRSTPFLDQPGWWMILYEATASDEKYPETTSFWDLDFSSYYLTVIEKIKF